MSGTTLHRTNIVLDLKLVKKAQRATGQNTITGVVHSALKSIIDSAERRNKMQKMLKYQGTGVWEEDLRKMRKNRAKYINL